MSRSFLNSGTLRVKTNYFLLASWRSLTKRAGSRSVSKMSGSGSVPTCHGSGTLEYFFVGLQEGLPQGRSSLHWQHSDLQNNYFLILFYYCGSWNPAAVWSGSGLWFRLNYSVRRNRPGSGLNANNKMKSSLKKKSFTFLLATDRLFIIRVHPLLSLLLLLLRSGFLLLLFLLAFYFLLILLLLLGCWLLLFLFFILLLALSLLLPLLFCSKNPRVSFLAN